MKTETKRETKEVFTEIFIADDGTEFKNESDCERYEYGLNLKELEEKIEILELKKLKDTIPLDTYGSSITEGNEFRWFKVTNKNDVDVILRWCGKGRNYIPPEQYPDIVCVEDDGYGKYPMLLSEMKQETINFWKKFGLKVNFEEVNEND